MSRDLIWDPDEGPEVHTVAAGETLTSIAQQRGTTWMALYDGNYETIGPDPNLIVAGQRLIVPIRDYDPDEHRAVVELQRRQMISGPVGEPRPGMYQVQPNPLVRAQRSIAGIQQAMSVLTLWPNPFLPGDARIEKRK